MVAFAFQGGNGMASMFRFGTEPVRLALSGGFAALFWLGVCAAPAWAQQEDEQGTDEDEAVQLSCDDGTQLNAAFGDGGVAVTLADGSTVTLPQKNDDKGFLYSNGKFTLSGDDTGASWTVGRKTPVPCHFNEQGQSQPQHFDEPLTIDNRPLPKDKDNPDANPVVNCYRFINFMIKEVDLGEVGAESLAVAPSDAACERSPGENEKPIKDDIAGYFFGAKDNLAFFQASDGLNGGEPFVVYDVTTMKRLFDDSYQGSDFESLDVSGSTVKIVYRRVYSADCSLYKEGAACADKVKAETGLGTADAQLPDCGPAYEAEKKRTPKFAKEIEDLPSVIFYEAELDFDGTTKSVKALKGDSQCHVPD
jgi:hypothetical protein